MDIHTEVEECSTTERARSEKYMHWQRLPVQTQEVMPGRSRF